MTGNAEVKKGVSDALPAAAVLIVIVLAAALAIRTMAPPKAVPTDAPPEVFSAERAYKLLKDIAVKPHPLGTPAHDEVRDRILGMWRDLGFEPEVQKGLDFNAKGHYAARVENILVRLPGTKPVPGGALMLASHYDSVEAAPGAADAGSGVVTLLETARALKAGPPLSNDVIFLITDGEEDGLIGAVVFQTEHPWAKDIGLVLNFEARGTTGPSLMFETSLGNQALISALAMVPNPRAYSFSTMVYRMMPNGSDLSVWMEAGIQGMNFAFIGRPYDYHTAGDNLARLDLRSLQHHGSYALALARRFGDGGVPPKSRGDAVYFSFLGGLFIRYSRTTAILLVVLIAALLAIAGGLGIKRGILRLGGILRGVCFLLASLILSGGLGFGFLSLVRASHGAWLQSGPWPYSLGYFLAMVALAAAATMFLHGLFRARKSGLETAFGAAALWLGLAAAVTFLAYDASYLAAWPALFLAFGVLAWAGFGAREGTRAVPPFWCAALAAAGVVFIAAPLSFLFFEAMFLSPLIAAGLGVLIAIMLAAMLPALEIVRNGLGRGLPVLMFGLFIIAAVVSALATRYTDEIPQLASLQYRRDYDANQANWVTTAKTPDAWSKAVAGGEFRAGLPQPEYAGRLSDYFSREAPVWDGISPDIRLVEDRQAGSSRELRVRVVSPRGGRRFVISCEAEKIVSAAVEGRPLVLIPENAKGFAFRFLNPGLDGFEIAIEAAASSPIRINVRETNPGFPGLPGFVPPPPPSRLRPHRIDTLLTKTFLFPPSAIK